MSNMGQKPLAGIRWYQKLEGGAWFYVEDFFTSFSKSGIMQAKMPKGV